MCKYITKLNRLFTYSLLVMYSTILHDVSNAYSNGVYVAETGHELEQFSFKELLKRIESKFDVNISYSDDLIGAMRPLAFTKEMDNLPSTMNSVLSPLKLYWDFVDGNHKNIVIFKRSTSLDHSLDSFKIASGIVYGEDGKVLEGVTIKNKNTGSIVTTDANGVFRLFDCVVGQYIDFSYVGFKKRTLVFEGVGMGNVILIKEINELDQRIVIGYGTTSKRLNTGSISKVKGEDIARQSVSDPILSLQGRVPGLLIRQSSGVAGAAFSIVLRGINSISNGSNPLVVVDGVPYPSNELNDRAFRPGAAVGLSPFNNINPSDIESIEILKDADATAIYGTRGANGVLLITTKRPKISRLNANLNLSTGWGSVARKMDLLNTKDYLVMRLEALQNDGLSSPSSSDFDINGVWDSTRYTDWQKVFIGNTANSNTAQLTVSGGNENTQMTFRSSWNRETLVYPKTYPTKNSSMHLSVSNTSSDKRFNINASTSYSVHDIKSPGGDITNYIYLAPNAPKLYDSLGNLNWENETWSNPYADLMKDSRATTRNFNGTVALSYHILQGADLKINMGYTNIAMKQTLLTPMTAYQPSYQSFTTLRTNFTSDNDIDTWIVEPQFNYAFNVDRLHIKTLLGGTLQSNRQKQFGVLASGFTSDILIENLLAASYLYVLTNSDIVYRYLAAFSRISLDWDQKYIVNLTGRRDGSSRFGPDSRYGNFGAVGIAWVFSKEKFIENNIKVLSFGKLRASYGTTGIEPTTDYGYLSTYTSSATKYQDIVGLTPERLFNPVYNWETVRKMEAGLELGWIDNRVNFEFSYYRNKSGNQLLAYPLPYLTGFSSVQTNLPASVGNSGTEYSLNSNNIRRESFSWSTNINISFQSNKLLAYPDLDRSSFANKYVVGKPLFISKGYNYLGVDQQTGLYTFEDVNKDGVISSPQDRQSIFTSFPSFFGGIQNMIVFGNWDINLFFNFVKQKSLMYSVFREVPGSFNANQPQLVMSRWRNPGDNSEVQRFSQMPGDPAAAFSYFSGSNALTDASFLRLKNVYIAYRLPEAYQRILRVEDVKFYVQSNNVFTLTRYKGLDPETTPMSLPPVRMIIGGINLTF